MSRVINITGIVNSDMATNLLGVTSELREEINSEIAQIVAHNQKVKEDYFMAPEPLVVNVSCPGGQVVYGNAIIDELMDLNVPIITRSCGTSMSMGYLIYLVGDYRLMGESSTLMYHGVSNVHNGTISDIETGVEFDKMLEQLGDDLVVQRTKITQDQLDFFKERSKNWYMLKKEALENGSATHDLELEEVIELAKKNWIEDYKSVIKEREEAGKIHTTCDLTPDKLSKEVIEAKIEQNLSEPLENQDSNEENDKNND